VPGSYQNLLPPKKKCTTSEPEPKLPGMVRSGHVCPEPLPAAKIYRTCSFGGWTDCV
jgi:hypothetical protein